MRKHKSRTFDGRRYLLLIVIIAVFCLLFMRAVQLQLLNADFYHQAGSERHLRTVSIAAHRGSITDRYGEALAISTPVYSIWAHPKTSLANPDAIAHTAKVLGISNKKLTKKLRDRKDKQFVYLRRHVFPNVVQELQQKTTTGISTVREYRRYYPDGEISSHIVGLTNIDDQGIEGIEFAYDDWLKGIPGKKRVLRDGNGTIVSNIELIQEPHHGKDLQLSIDKRIQYLTYRELKRTIAQHQAQAGSVVILSVDSGEVLAMANLPSFNPNDRIDAKYDAIRNRAITDVFEPGSTIKPFLIAAALDSGAVKVNSRINTSPGYFNVRGLQVSDNKNHGVMDIQTILAKSSNVGAVRVALKLSEEEVWNQYQAVGFGQLTGSGFPGERAGKLDNYTQWNEAQRATLAYGYGISGTTLQLARAYSVIARDGVLLPTSFIVNNDSVSGYRVMSANTAKQLRGMLHHVVSKQGTAHRAMMESYTAAGKTGTSRKLNKGKYLDDQHISLFAGMAPAKQPRIVVVVVIDRPTKGGYYGGDVAAPLFSRITDGTLRLLNVPPEHVDPAKRGLLLTAVKAK